MTDPLNELRAALLRFLPEWSEFRPSTKDGDEAQTIRHGRQVTIPLMVDPPGSFSGTLFTDPTVQPSPPDVLRLDGLSEEETTVIYLSWLFAPGNYNGRPISPPDAPMVLALVRWGVGGVVFQRMLDVHKVPRRLAVACNWVEIRAAYPLDFGAPGANAALDVVAGIATGEADPNYWTGIWTPTMVAGHPPAQIIQQPAAILAITGTLIALPAGGAYIFLVDCLPTAPPTTLVSLPIPGTVSPLLSPGTSFSFSEDEMPGAFADKGVAYVVSSTPHIYTDPGVAGTTAFVQVKVAV